MDYPSIRREALPLLPALLRRWLPGGRRSGWEWVATNPTRLDRHAGSFKINLRTGRWADFATDAKGRDVIGLAAYLFGISRREAAQNLANMLGIQEGER